jgi:hypothetical protein
MRKRALGFAVAALLATAVPGVFGMSSALAATEFPGTGLATNYDWAYLVLQDGGWPSTMNNLTVMTRWMDSEEPASDWWDRNNPLNNGLGSGGGSGLGSYASVVDAAYYVAANLDYDGLGYPAIAADLAASAAPGVTAKAIWDSSWASGHYGHGKSWFDGSADDVSAPPRAWGSDVVFTYPAGTLGPGAYDGFTLSGPPQYWHSSAPFGLEGDARWTYSDGATGGNGATWAPTLSSGSYKVLVYVPDGLADASVTYVVTDASGTHKVPIDQAPFAGKWVPLGLFTAGTTGSIRVHVTNASTDTVGATYVGVDAMEFERAGATSVVYPMDTVGPGGAGFALSGPSQSWHAGAPYGLKGNAMWATSDGALGSASVQWSPTLSPGTYDVQAFVPMKYASAHVTYVVTDAQGTHDVAVDQAKLPNQWANLGEYTTGMSASISLRLTNASADPAGSTDVGADAVKFVASGSLLLPASSTSFTATPQRAQYGAEATYAASVQGSGGAPSGTVTFSFGATLLCSAQVTSGSARCETSYTPVGTRVVTARYLGGSSFAPSSATGSVLVVRASSTTTVTVEPRSVALGGIVTYNVSVLGANAIPSGAVRIGVDGVVVCSARLVAGRGSCVAAGSQQGHHVVFARYGGDGHFMPSADKTSLTVT